MPRLEEPEMIDLDTLSINPTLAKRTLTKRDIPFDGTGEWNQWYQALAADPNTETLVNDAETGRTLASWVRYRWEMFR